ncbi:MAG: hypothetical protein QW040_00535 [Candidatus Aenigmatarchaeota archaeon]
MKGISTIDYIYIIILFLLVAIVILGILIFTSKELIENIKSGKIWNTTEEFLRRVIKGGKP